MSGAAAAEMLTPELLARLPSAVQRPGYDRSALRAGMAHIGVGAFHRCHQAEYTDDLLAVDFGRWGVVGINIRPPALAGSLGRQAGLYTRLVRENERIEARVVGSILSVVDSQLDARPALDVLASAETDVVTMTVTEKGYCHRPATGQLDGERAEIAHDLGNPQLPRSLPGLIVRALELRMASHGRPLTLVSCDNIPANGVLLGNVVRALADHRGRQLSNWIAANAAFPSTMVDRIAPAVTEADTAAVEERFGYRDAAVAVAEPFRQWVIETRFADRFPEWNRVGASFVEDVAAFEHLKMRVLNAAQSALAYLGVLSGHEHSFEAVADPLLTAFVTRMLLEETLPTLEPVPGVDPAHYLEQSLARLRNTAIRHRNHQIATDGSQKIVQRLLNPLSERLTRGQSFDLLALPVAAWMVYLLAGAERFGHRWSPEDPFAAKVAAIGERIGGDPDALVASILALDAIFAPALAADQGFRGRLSAHLEGLLSDDPLAHLRRVLAGAPTGGLNAAAQRGIVRAGRSG